VTLVKFSFTAERNMIGAAATVPSSLRLRMTSLKSTSEEIAAFGRALRLLRERSTMSVTSAAQEAGLSRQAWSKYEAGETASILRSDIRRRLCKAIGVEEDELETLAHSGASPESMRTRSAKPTDFSLPVLGRIQAGALGPQIVDPPGGALERVDLAWMFGPDAGIMQVAGDSVTGRAESGQRVIYDKSLWPKKDQLCVIHKSSGEVYLKIYLKTDASNLFVTQTFPAKTLTFPLTEVLGVYRVRWVEE
jgi:transcriptional regulator with XRE-family HTH domain